MAETSSKGVFFLFSDCVYVHASSSWQEHIANEHFAIRQIVFKQLLKNKNSPLGDRCSQGASYWFWNLSKKKGEGKKARL